MSAPSASRRPAGPTATRTRPSRTQAAGTAQKKRIDLVGSTAIVSDYFHYAINCILYQRAVYSSQEFKMVKKFGLQMMVIEEDVIAEYIVKIIDQVRVWLTEGKISGLVLVIQNQKTKETVERWEFNVVLEDEAGSAAEGTPQAAAPAPPKSTPKPKSLNEIQSEIQAIIRQITASVSFLPIPDYPRTFKVLAYTHRVGENEAADWIDCKPLEIGEGAERVKLKSFSTAVHEVHTAVDYKVDDSVV